VVGGWWLVLADAEAPILLACRGLPIHQASQVPNFNLTSIISFFDDTSMGQIPIEGFNNISYYFLTRERHLRNAMPFTAVSTKELCMQPTQSSHIPMTEATTPLYPHQRGTIPSFTHIVSHTSENWFPVHPTNGKNGGTNHGNACLHVEEDKLQKKGLEHTEETHIWVEAYHKYIA
jgi:hypothetical protein